MLNAISAYIDGKTQEMPNLDIGFAFVDVQTGQLISLQGSTPHYALSTFKGPLGVFYLWLIEHGQIQEQPTDNEHIIPMLNVSSNPDTTCILKRVGGLVPFNDWLADQGFTRETNFVFRWQNWGCKEGNDYYLPDSDWRYGRGDASLGLPGDYVLMRCAPGISCDKVLVPDQLAQFYAWVYRGEIIDAGHTATWLDWMEKSHTGSALFGGLPEDAGIHVYAKNGFRSVDAFYNQNFFNEAGIIETPQGAFALAVFMRGNPDFPGEGVIREIARIAYEYFVAAYSTP